MHRFRQVGHLDQLVLDVGRLRAAVVLGHGSRRTDDDVRDAHLAGAVVLAVESGESLDEFLREFGLAAHEDLVPGDEDVVQDGQGLAADDGERGVAGVDIAFQTAVLVRLAAEDMHDARRIDGDDPRNGVVLVFRSEVGRGQDEHLVRVDHAGLVRLRAADDHAVFAAFHDVHEEVRIRLGAGFLAAVTLGVGHGTGHHDVGLLDVFQVLLDAFVVIRPVFLVDLIRGDVRGVDRVQTDAALKARAGLLPDRAQQQHLVDEVFRALVHVGKAVDRLARQVGSCGRQFLVFGVEGDVIGHGGGIHVGRGHGILHHVFDLPAVAVDDRMKLLQAFPVLLSVHHSRVPLFNLKDINS